MLSKKDDLALKLLLTHPTHGQRTETKLEKPQQGRPWSGQQQQPG